MIDRRLIAAVLATLPFLTACSKRPGFFGTSATTSYSKILDRETREKRYFSLEKVEYATNVTFRSEDLRRAYVEEYASLYNLPNEKKAELLKNEMDEALGYYVFVVSHFSAHRDGSRLSERSKVWRMALSTMDPGDTGAEPDVILELPSARDSVTRYFYPYVTTWSSNYLVKFKKAAPASRLHVRMTGVLGDMLFSWNKVETEEHGTDPDRTHP